MKDLISFVFFKCKFTSCFFKIVPFLIHLKIHKSQSYLKSMLPTSFVFTFSFRKQIKQTWKKKPPRNYLKVLISAAISHLIIMLLLLSKVLLVSLHLLTSKKVCISFIPGQGSEIKNLPSVRQTTLDFPSIFKEVLTYATPLLMVTLSPKRRLF